MQLTIVCLCIKLGAPLKCYHGPKLIEGTIIRVTKVGVVKGEA